MFLCRACKEILPTYQNLKKRKIIDRSSCPICLVEEENTAHALWSCLAAQDTWSQASPKIQKISYHSQAFMEVWRHLVCKLDQLELSEATFVFKLIWFRRNEFLHGKNLINPSSLIQRGKNDFTLYLEAMSTDRTSFLMPWDNCTWTKPPLGKFKLNWNAALDQ